MPDSVTDLPDVERCVAPTTSSSPYLKVVLESVVTIASPLIPRLQADTRQVDFLGALLSSSVSRRRMLVAGLGMVAAACAGRQQTGSSVTPSATSASSAIPVATPKCIVTPSETEGPYFVADRLNRSDIRVDPLDGSVRPGVPLTLTLAVAKVGTSCTALAGAQVDVWHCDALGVYSDVSAENTVGRKYLRGYQTTDANGAVRFTTVYPGWYQGRAVHVHFKVRTYAGAQKTYEFTSQLFFDDSISDTVYRQAPYSSRGARDTRNANDMVYTSNNNSGAMLLANLTQTAAGYHAEFAVGLKIS